MKQYFVLISLLASSAFISFTSYHKEEKLREITTQTVATQKNKSAIRKRTTIGNLKFGYTASYAGDCVKVSAGICMSLCGNSPSDCGGRLATNEGIGSFTFKKGSIRVDITEYNLSKEYATLLFKEKVFPIEQGFSLREDLVRAILSNSNLVLKSKIIIPKGKYKALAKKNIISVKIPINNGIVKSMVLNFKVK